MTLTPRQARFVEEYLIDLNAGAAARRAGYQDANPRRVGWRTLHSPKVAEAIRIGMEARARRVGIDPDRVMHEYARMAFSDIRRAVSWRTAAPEEGEGAARRRAASSEIQVLDAALLDDDTSAAIAEISQGAGGAVRIKMHDKKGALDALARRLGLFDAHAPAAGDGAQDKPKEMYDRLDALSAEQRTALRAAIRAAVGR